MKMSLFNLADIESSTLLLASNSLDEMDRAIHSIVKASDLAGLSGLCLSIVNERTNEYAEFEAEHMLDAMRALKVFNREVLV